MDIRTLGKQFNSLYEAIWWTVEGWFGVPPDQRRPWTYVMRDIYHNYAAIVVPSLAFFFYGLSYWLKMPAWVFWLVVATFFLGELVGHLFWGTPYVPNQHLYKPTAQVQKWILEAQELA